MLMFFGPVGEILSPEIGYARTKVFRSTTAEEVGVMLKSRAEGRGASPLAAIALSKLDISLPCPQKNFEKGSHPTNELLQRNAQCMMTEGVVTAARVAHSKVHEIQIALSQI